MEQQYSVDFTEDQDFQGKMEEFCNELIKQDYAVLVNAKHIGVQTKDKKTIDVSDLMVSNDIDFSNELYGILIPQQELLSRTKYQWFLKLTPEEVLTSNTIIGKHMMKVLLTC